ncbi:pentatricopeptide repeat-containing protein At2g13600-like [Cornus florida]|uniref:pentatricopeptide repeat-containing protein At2g13600-like n=1 Tax=Cornus florida TaxID=4283 RepID=UPI00289BB122|nr:pentatricopeptide repeat-containing protein At2g13600-like [Cornus florida]
MVFNLTWRPRNHLPSLLSAFLFRFISNQKSLSRKLVRFHNPILQHQSYSMDLSQRFLQGMKACSTLRSIPIARELHAQLISTGLVSSVFLQNHLVNMYSNCGSIDDAYQVFLEIDFRNVFSWNTMINGFADLGRMGKAEQLFDEMPERDSVSWNSIMSGYFHNGQPEDAIKVFVLMIRDCNCFPDSLSLSCVMKACASLGHLNLAVQLHALAEKFGFGRDFFLESSIIDMYIKCGALNFAERVFSRTSNPSLFCWNSMIYGYSKLCGVGSSLDLFSRMPEHDAVSWNTIISILSQHGYGAQSLDMFIQMWIQGFRPNSMTYASALSACTGIYDLRWGLHLHARIIRMESSLDVYVGSGLIDMYAKCGCLESARRVFDMLPEHNAVSWTSLIGGLAHFGHEKEALALFKQMREVPVASDQFTLATILGVCSNLKDSSLGGQLHAYAINVGLDFYVPVGNAIVTMYSRCGNVQSASYTFELMPIRDIVSWTAMITAFSQAGNVEYARKYFDKMPERNIVSWNSMLATYIQHGLWEDGLRLYILMFREEVKTDWITFTTSISACADSAVLVLGKQIIAQAEKLGFCCNVSVVNSIVAMYSKCGQIRDAEKVFDSTVMKDLISWNTMMAGYSQSGQGRKVIETFQDMLKLGFTPDHISYVSVLSGCSHSGLLHEGQHYFSVMTKDHGISPTCEHFACMVDLLGRAGLLEQAKDLINEMPLEPNAAVWGALLGACRIHGERKLAEIALKNLIKLDEVDSGSYVLLANIYSDSGKLEGVSDMRKLMKEKGIRKNPGCSWIEVDNRVHVFNVDDTNHPQIKDVRKMLEEIAKKIEGLENDVNETVSVQHRSYHSKKTSSGFWDVGRLSRLSSEVSGPISGKCGPHDSTNISFSPGRVGRLQCSTSQNTFTVQVQAGYMYHLCPSMVLI